MTTLWRVVNSYNARSAGIGGFFDAAGRFDQEPGTAQAVAAGLADFTDGWIAIRNPIAPRMADRLRSSELPDRESVRYSVVGLSCARSAILATQPSGSAGAEPYPPCAR